MTESVRNDPEKFSSLIYYDTAAHYNRSPFTDEQQLYSSKDSFKQAYMDMLSDEAEKLYTALAKHLEDEIINEYASIISVAAVPSSPMLLEDNQQQRQKP